jgi:GH15 family glucan-1,4-alpha-glucosidase
MSKSLVLGNGNLLIGFDNRGQVRDFYFPYVGLENQAGGMYLHRIGVFVDGLLSWFDDPNWSIYINYQEEAMVSDIQAVNNALQIKIDFNDVVYNERNIFIRRATVHNLADRKRQIKLFFHQEFELYESYRGDTAYFDPVKKVIVHYKGRRVLLINAKLGNDPASAGFDDYSVGLFKIEGKEGTFVDAEDGLLSKNPVEHGLVDSVIGLTFELEPQGALPVFYWIVAGNFIKEVHQLNQYVVERTPQYLIGTTRDFWHAWVNKHNFSFADLGGAVASHFKKSLLIIRTHVDNRGAIVASGDSGFLYHGKDTYAYMWPRDGAFVAESLDKAGDFYVVKKFFEFCNQIISEEGYFMQRYRADMSVGSSWHPFIRDGLPSLPIQEDETALIIYALWNHYESTKDLEYIESIYNSLIKKSAEFMLVHREPTTGLPKPSYNLWEEKYGISTFTCSTVYASLVAASKFASLLGKTDAENRYMNAAKDIQGAIVKYLYDSEVGYFYQLINIKDGEIEKDGTLDASSAYGVFKFGVLPVSDERLIKAMKLTEDGLTLNTEVGGLARYVGDKYFLADENKIGNPWFITTLWLSQFKIASAKEQNDLLDAKKILEWAVRCSLPSGVMAEQVNPYSAEPISAAPLIWSHAEFVTTVIKYLEKAEELGIEKDLIPK